MQAPSVKKLVKQVKQRQQCNLTLVIYDKTEEPPVSASTWEGGGWGVCVVPKALSACSSSMFVTSCARHMISGLWPLGDTRHR